jgi:hypothetical protein
MAVVALAVLASGCVQERVVHDRPIVVEHPVRRDVVVEQPVQREVVEVIAPQPPPPREVEIIPAPRRGYVWAHGYWRWDGRRYVAVGGHWEAARPGYRYVHPHWEQHRDGWHWRVGVWVAG